MDFEILTSTIPGRVYKTNSLYVGEFESFIGFAKNTVSNTANVEVVIDGIVSGLSLNQGRQYYIANSPNCGSCLASNFRGTISTNIGDKIRKAGISLSNTELLITNNW